MTKRCTTADDALKRTIVQNKSNPNPSGCTYYFPFRGPKIGAHHIQDWADKRDREDGEWSEKRGRNVPEPPPELTTQDSIESQPTGSGQDSQYTSQQSESDGEDG